MPITVRCACGKEYCFKDEYAGRRAKCPACGQVVRIPGTRAPGTPKPRLPSRGASPEGEQSRTVVLAVLGFAGFVILVGIGLVVYFLFLSGPAPRTPKPAAPSPAAQQPSAAVSHGQAPASGPPAPAAGPASAPAPSPTAGPVPPPPPAPPAPASAAMSAAEILRRLGDQEVAFTDFAEERMADPLWVLRMFDSKTLTHWADLLKDDPGPLDLTFQLKVPLAADRVATLLGAKPAAEEKGNFNWKDASENPPSVVPTPVTYLRYGDVAFAANDSGSVVGLTVRMPARGERPSGQEGLRRVLGIGVAAPPGDEEESEADEIGKRGDVMLKGILAALGLAKEPMQVTRMFNDPSITLEPQNPKPLDHYRRTLGPEEGQRADDRGGNPITWYTYGWLEVGVRDGAATVMVIHTDRVRAVARALRNAPAAPATAGKSPGGPKSPEAKPTAPVTTGAKPPDAAAPPPPPAVAPASASALPRPCVTVAELLDAYVPGEAGGPVDEKKVDPLIRGFMEGELKLLMARAETWPPNPPKEADAWTAAVGAVYGHSVEPVSLILMLWKTNILYEPKTNRYRPAVAQVLRDRVRVIPRDSLTKWQDAKFGHSSGIDKLWVIGYMMHIDRLFASGKFQEAESDKLAIRLTKVPQEALAVFQDRAMEKNSEASRHAISFFMGQGANLKDTLFTKWDAGVSLVLQDRLFAEDESFRNDVFALVYGASSQR